MDTVSLFDRMSDQNLFLRVKALLGLVFVGAVTSSLFKRFYYDYNLISLDDFSSCYNYFIDGHFLLPFSLFYIIWSVTDFFARLLFTFGVQVVGRNWQKRIENYAVKTYLEIVPVDSKVRDRLELFTKAAKLEEVHKSMKDPDKSASSLYSTLIKRQRALEVTSEKDFILNFRAILAITLFVNKIPEFSILLYLVVLVVVIWNLASSIVSNRIAGFIRNVIGEVQASRTLEG